MHYNIKSDINLRKYAFFNTCRVAILDAILNNSKCSMMPAGHHSDSDSTLLPLPKSAITWFGGIFARLPPLAAGIIDGCQSIGRLLCRLVIRLLQEFVRESDHLSSTGKLVMHSKMPTLLVNRSLLLVLVCFAADHTGGKLLFTLTVV